MLKLIFLYFFFFLWRQEQDNRDINFFSYEVTQFIEL